MRNKPQDNYLKTFYSDYVKILKKVIKCAKNKFDENDVQKKSKNKISLWQYINKKLKGTENTNKKELDHLMINGVKETCKIKIANEYNNFYSNIGTILANKIDKTNESLNLPKCNCKSFYIETIIFSEIIKTIHDLP